MLYLFFGWGVAILLAILFIFLDRFINGIAIFASVIAIFILCVYLVLLFPWIASEHKVKIINKEYGTTYTQEEVFFAFDVIKTIQQLKRERRELNGNLLKEKE